MLVNGAAANSIDATDRGLLYGDGLFETLALIEGQPCLWQRHMARLAQGCARLAIPMPDPDLLREEAEQLIGASPQAVLKIVVTRGAGGRGYRPAPAVHPTRLLQIFPWPDHPAAAAQAGIKARYCQTRLGCNPALAGIKHLNRLEQVLARAEWQDETVAEGIMLDVDGRVIEATQSNLFAIRDGVLFTPDLSRCGIAGVMRGLIVDIARQLGLVVHVVDLYPDDLARADALFCSNSLIGIWPVAALGGRLYDIRAIPKALTETVTAQGFAP